MTLPPSKILIIDDDKDFSASLVQMLEVEGYNVVAYNDPFAALRTISTDFDGVILLDLRMPRASGEDLLERLLEIDDKLPVIIITGHGDIPMAVRALKQGAYGFFAKPLQIEEFMHDVQRAQTLRSVEIERRKLARQIEMRDDLLNTVQGTSPKMVQLRQSIAKIGSAPVDVLIQGETGSGKEVVARALVQNSTRQGKPFVAVNCGNIHVDRSMEEFFGIEIPTDNDEPIVQKGHFERANGGTLLLDEVESMPINIQIRLLRVLQERSLLRINGTQAIDLDIKILATTKSDLRMLVDKGQFREDLYYRLNGVTLSVPPLRGRGADPVVLFELFLKDYDLGETQPAITTELMSDLLSHDWPGNVRELKNAAKRFAAGLHVFADSAKQGNRSDSLSVRVASFEKGLIESTLERNEGSLKRTMLDLDVPRKTLQDKLNKYGISRKNYAP